MVNTGTGLEWQTKSNESGNYAFSILPPGAYRVTVRKEGFEAAVRNDIELTVSQVARLDFTLKVGATTEVVEVKAAAPLLESDTASTGQLIATKSINDLPLNGRNYLQLAKLSMGVMEPTPGDRGTAGGSFIANGVRAQLNNFLLDGVDNNAKIVDQQNSSPVVIQPSVDALQEFRVETNNYSAQYGYSAGAVVNAMIKSGTNAFHGNVFEFLRNSALDARNFFATEGTPKPMLQQNQFGGVIGGPIIKNRAFFFGSWERTTIDRGNTYVTTVPTAAMRQGDFTSVAPIYDPNTSVRSDQTYTRSQFPNNQIPLDRMDPAALKLLAAEPLPTFPDQTVNNYVSSPTNTTRANRIDVKEDTQLRQNDSMFARYSYFGGNAVTYGPFPAPLVGSTNFQIAPKDDLGNAAALGETHIFTPTLVNEFRAGYNRIQDFLSPFVKDNIAASSGRVAFPSRQALRAAKHIDFRFREPGRGDIFAERKISETITAGDNLSWTVGKHLVKFRGDYRWVRSWFDISSNARGSYSFNGAFTNNPQKTAAPVPDWRTSCLASRITHR